MFEVFEFGEIFLGLAVLETFVITTKAFIDVFRLHLLKIFFVAKTGITQFILLSLKIVNKVLLTVKSIPQRRNSYMPKPVIIK